MHQEVQLPGLLPEEGELGREMKFTGDVIQVRKGGYPGGLGLGTSAFLFGQGLPAQCRRRPLLMF